MITRIQSMWNLLNHNSKLNDKRPEHLFYTRVHVYLYATFPEKAEGIICS